MEPIQKCSHYEHHAQIKCAMCLLWVQIDIVRYFGNCNGVLFNRRADVGGDEADEGPPRKRARVGDNIDERDAVLWLIKMLKMAFTALQKPDLAKNWWLHCIIGKIYSFLDYFFF